MPAVLFSAVEGIRGSELPRLLLTFASVLLGAMLFLIVLNRSMNYLRDGKYKIPLAAITFFTTLVGFGWLSYAFYPNVSTWLVGGGFGLVGLGEAHRIWVNRRCRGETPVRRDGPKRSWRKPMTTTDLQVVQYEVPLAGWRGRPFRVVHLSDLHLHTRLPLAYFESVVEMANQFQADLVFITGDFVTGLSNIQQLPGLLQKLYSRYGVYGVLGNHDYWSDLAQVIEAAQRGGVQLLQASIQQVDINAGQPIWLAGCQAPWSGERCGNLEIGEDRCVIGLSHSADYIYPLSRVGVKAVFSGHFHAGQFQLPLLGPVLVPSRYGRRFYQGHFVVNAAHLFVSAGIGCAAPALRVYCPPEMLVVDFTPLSAPAPDKPG